MSAKDMVTEFKPAIVRVEVGPDRVGTGFVIDRSGLVVTNLHVVVAADDIQVRMSDGAMHKVQRVRAYDASHDLAILDIDPPVPIPALTIGDSDAASPGDPVFAIGNPLGVLDYTVSDGLLSGVRVLPNEITLLQISAPISEGSSGGPVFNAYGEVIGVVTAFLSNGQNLNFAIPAKFLVALSAAAPKPQTMAEFKDETQKLISEAEARAKLESGEEIPEARIQRLIPDHELKIFDGCAKEEIADTADAIDRAIKIGAPLYNAGGPGIEACFRIYELVVAMYEKRSTCAGIRTAFGDGLQRAGTMKTAKEKAWALRDTFDGMLHAINRWAQGPTGPAAVPKGKDK